jgi:acetyl esterase
MLLRDDMIWYHDHYLQQLNDGKSPYASPLLCDDLSGLPPAHVITAEFDVLRDEGEAYAHRLHQAGNEVTCVRYNGVIHGFMSMDGILSKADEAITDAANILRQRHI